MKIVKGDLMRVGWVTQGFSSSNAIGMDESSYAIDGFRVCSNYICTIQYGIVLFDLCRLLNGTKVMVKSLVKSGKSVIL